MNRTPHDTTIASPRTLPTAARADVLVVGGTVAACAAALEARSRGASVYLAAPRLYLGDDRCGTLRLWRDDDATTGDAPLLDDLFGSEPVTTPLLVKRTLARRLLDAGVTIRMGCLPVGAVVDDDGAVRGAVLADRSGRRAVVAGAVIDATRHALVARSVESDFRTTPSTITARCVVLGGEPESDAGAIRRPETVTGDDGAQVPVFEYTRDIDPERDTPAAWSRAERSVRYGLPHANPWRVAELLDYTPPPPSNLPDGLTHLPWDADEPTARAMAAEAAQAAGEQAIDRLRIRSAGASASAAASSFDLAAHGDPFRDTDAGLPRIDTGLETLPVLDRVDVVVVGGGTAGAAAGIAAAREGRRVLAIEFQEGLGGIGTVGAICMPYHGLGVGFAATVPFDPETGGIERKMSWLHRELAKAGGEVWLRSLAWGALVDDRRVGGVAVATPFGHGVVRADVTIDATGNADVAALSGAATEIDANDDVAVQGAGWGVRTLGNDHGNNDSVLIDDSDATDVTRTALGRALGAEPFEAFDLVPIAQTRERRRVAGRHRLRYLDQVLGRTYGDTICVSKSDYDTHGYPNHPVFALLPHTDETRVQNHPAPAVTEMARTPYRALLPRDVEGLLVIGLGTSMERDASALMRMQYDLLNQGYAAGLAAAAASAQAIVPGLIDVRTLQRRLADDGCLPEGVPNECDGMPEDTLDLAIALDRYLDDSLSYEERSRGLAIVMNRPRFAAPALRDAWRQMPDDDGRRILVARMLGILGEDDGADLLMEDLARTTFDERIPQGNMAEFGHLPTPVDASILALGFCRCREAVPVIVEKVRALDAESVLSHHRSVALALERLADPRAADPLAELLNRPGMSGHVMTTVEPLVNKPTEKHRRTGPLREIVLARALVRCGDCDGLGRGILEGYRHDLRGYLARHARAVLGSLRAARK